MPKIYFPIFTEAEVLDFSGPFDVFSMAMVATGTVPYDLVIVSVGGKTVRALHGFTVVPAAAMEDCQPTEEDIVVLPGGGYPIINAVATTEPHDPRTEAIKAVNNPKVPPELTAECQAIVDWLAGPARGAGIVATICVGGLFGAKAGLFNGDEKVTTHNGRVAHLGEWLGDPCRVIPGARYVMNRSGTPLIMSSAGVSAGMDLAFDMIGLLLGVDARQRTMKLMEYNGTVNFGVTRPDLPNALKYGERAVPRETAEIVDF